MRILVATDAWHPQVNGVVRTLTTMAEAARTLGVEVSFLTPQSFRTVGLPSYPDLRVALPGPVKIARLIAEARADNIHIATEGPIGMAVRRYCRQRGLPLHHQLPHPLPRIHFRAAADSGILDLGLAAPVSRREPGGDGGDAGAGRRIARPRFSQCRAVAARRRHRAVPSARRRSRSAAPDLPVGRPGGGGEESRGLSGDSTCRAPRWWSATVRPRAALQRRYPEAVFLGARQGEALAEAYAGADVFVFPSRTDTFGLVLLEALASGVPVAAFPVSGPRDVMGDAPVGALNEDLRLACLAALEVSPQACLAFASQLTWQASARAFVDNIARVRKVDPEHNADAASARHPQATA